MVNILIFANCHGVIYKNTIEKTALPGFFEIEHVLSYENLDKYNELKEKFSACDVLIIQPVENYEEFKIENIRLILKNTCLVVKVPFVRFDGFWLSDDSRNLDKFSSAAVMMFPNISHENEISDYLSGASLDEKLILDTFQQALNRFVELETKSSIKFVDFFLRHYRKIPLFRDPWHPTGVLFRYIAIQVAEAVFTQYPNSINAARSEITLSWNKEYGHFKPISDRCAKVLGLEYDLDSYFQYSRLKYLTAVLRYENNGGEKIMDLRQLKSLLNNAEVNSTKVAALSEPDEYWVAENTETRSTERKNPVLNTTRLKSLISALLCLCRGLFAPKNQE